MATRHWKLHEKAVADFFFTTRMGHKPRKGDETPSDVVVVVKDWLTALGRARAKEPWMTFIVECKYRKKSLDEAGWLRRFWHFHDNVPRNVDKNMQAPMLLFKEKWAIVRLDDWYRVYRAMFATRATGEQWLGQLMELFYIQHVNLTAPAYFREWLDGIGTVNTDTYGATLPFVCLGSSIARKGSGGGKVVIFNVDAGVKP